MSESEPKQPDGKKQGIERYLEAAKRLTNASVPVTRVAMRLAFDNHVTQAELAQILAGDYEDMEALSRVTGIPVEEIARGKDEAEVSESQIHMDALVMAIWRKTTDRMEPDARLSWKEFLRFASENDAAKALMKKNPNMSDAALKIISKAFALELTTDRFESELTEREVQRVRTISALNNDVRRTFFDSLTKKPGESEEP